jgi:hypothetical protein
MVRNYLIESRICFKGDGGGGSAADDARETATPAQTDDQGRPLARGTTNLIDTSRQILDPVGSSQEDEDVDQSRQQDIAAAATINNPQADPVQQQLIRDNYRRDPFPENRSAADIERDNAAIRETIAINQIPVGGQDLQGQIRTAVAESLSRPNRPDPVTPTRPPGRNDPQSGFFADAYDELYGGTPPGTGMATIFGGGPLGSLFNTPNPADAQAFNIGQLQRMVELTGTGTIDPNTGAVTGVQAGPGTLSMNSLGGIVYSGRNDPNYEGPFANLVRGTAGQNEVQSGDESQQMMQASATVDPGTTTPEQIDDLAVNYLRNPFYLYSGTGNLYQPYGYAGGTLVDLLQTRRMTQPQQAAANLNLFGNPRDFM